MQKRTKVASAALPSLCWLMTGAGWTTVVHAQRDKWADPPYVPMSRQTPKVVADLPSFGEIEWTVEQLPFVAKGPHGGISGMGMVVHDGRIYVMGGFIPAGDETEDRKSRRTSRWTHRYDPKKRTWTRLPDMPARREYTRAITARDAIYVMGGGIQMKGSDPAYGPSAACFKLDLTTQPLAWQTGKDLTVPRTHMAVGCTGNHLVAAGGNEYDAKKGGYHRSTIRAVTDVLDLSKPQEGWRQRTPIPGRARGWTASSVCDGLFYVFGGITFSEKSKQIGLDESLRYDPVKDRWTLRAASPMAISGWEGATYADRYVIIVGGQAPPCADRAVRVWNDLPFVYDTHEDRWMKIENPLPPGAVFNDPGVCIIGETIYVAGAEGPRGSHFDHFLVGRIRAGQ